MGGFARASGVAPVSLREFDYGDVHTPTLDGLELVLKGGQVGSEDFFERVRLASP